MKLNPLERKLMNKAVKKGNPINVVAKVFGVSRKTVWYWKTETLNSNFKDLPRKTQPSKITIEVELSILAMRTIAKWGTERIRKGLMNLPDFMRIDMDVKVQGVSLSRTSINNVLKKHRINGYYKKHKKWKFFRAKKPNELWQLDIKGPFRVEGKKYWILVVMDDHSRFILTLFLFDHKPKLEEIEEIVSPLIEKHKPKGILTDNNPFGKSWKKWLREQGVKAHFAHPYYPQDKGKIERAIRNLVEEFIHLLKHFSHWLDKLKDWMDWYNKKRYHCGIKDYPANLYVTL